MNVIKNVIKESDGVTLEVSISKSDTGVFFADYNVNGSFVKREEYPNKSIHFVESAAHNWLEGIKKLNG